jgi:hypothetical protein
VFPDTIQHPTLYVQHKRAVPEVSVGDGKRLEIKGVGSIKIEAMADGKLIPGMLTEVLYLPKLATNLFSIADAAMKGGASRIQR